MKITMSFIVLYTSLWTCSTTLIPVTSQQSSTHEGYNIRTNLKTTPLSQTSIYIS